jgi:hypothetical protein
MLFAAIAQHSESIQRGSNVQRENQFSVPIQAFSNPDPLMQISHGEHSGRIGLSVLRALRPSPIKVSMIGIGLAPTLVG